jgi:hypothetical protein
MQSAEVSSVSSGRERRLPQKGVARQTFSAQLKDGRWIATVATDFDDGTTHNIECGHHQSRMKALQDIERVLLVEAYPDPPDF